MSTGYRRWFEEHPEWLQAEIKSLQEAGFNLHLDEGSRAVGSIVFRGKVKAAGKYHEVLLLYPDGYPYQPPTVLAPRMLDRHQHPYECSLCVWPSAELDWDWHLTDAGAYVLKNAVELIGLSIRQPEVVREREERSPDPRRRYFPYTPESSVLVAPNMYGLPKGACGKMIVLGPTPRSPARGMVKRLDIRGPRDAELREAPDAWRGLFRGGGEVSGHWVKVNEPPPFWSTKEEFHSSLSAWIAERHPLGAQVLEWSNQEFGWYGTRVRLLGAVFPDEQQWGGDPEDHWIAVLEWEVDEQPLSGLGAAQPTRHRVVFRTHRVDGSEWFERIPQVHELADAKVAVFGLGAIGSSIALSLARAGAGRLYLLDEDVVEVGNLVRHEADICDVGFDKVSAIAARAFRANPTIEVRKKKCRLGGPSTLEEVASDIDGFSLVVSAFADWGSNLIVSGLAHQLRIPQVYVWTTNGAWGGEVLRVIPGETACLECFYFRIADKTSNESRLRPTSSEEPFVRPADCASPTFTGAGFDMVTVAMAASRLAVQTLLRGQTDQGYPDAPYHYASWQLRSGQALPVPAMKSGNIRPYQGCSTCGGGKC